MLPITHTTARAVRRLCLAGTILTLTAQPSRADDPVAALLAQPVSPGTLASLLAHPADPRVEPRWRESLSSPDARTRGTAARLLLTAGHTGSVNALLEALATETDEAAALEQATALLGMTTSGGESRVFAAARRFTPGPFATVIADARGPAALAFLEDFRQLTLTDQAGQQVVASIVGTDDAALDRVASVALESDDVDLWHAALQVAHSQSVTLAPARVSAALASPVPVIQELAWWHVAVVTAGKQGLPADLEASLATPDSPSTAGFARELARRVVRHERPRDHAALLEADAPQVPPFARPMLGSTLYEVLTKKEREALRVSRTEPALTRAFEASRRGDRGSKDHHRIRTVSALPAGYVADVLRVTGCTAQKEGGFGGALVSYDGQKRLRDIQWIADVKDDACNRASRQITAAALAVPRAKSNSDRSSLLLLPLHAPFLECLASESATRQPGSPAPPVRVGGPQKVVPPTRTRHVNPHYPQAAQASGRQGIVILEAIISPTGCVGQTEVLRGVSTDLDVAALSAVTQWGFTPTLLNDRPVPVIMTVTVQFSLR